MRAAWGAIRELQEIQREKDRGTLELGVAEILRKYKWSRVGERVNRNVNKDTLIMPCENGETVQNGWHGKGTRTVVLSKDFSTGKRGKNARKARNDGGEARRRARLRIASGKTRGLGRISAGTARYYLPSEMSASGAGAGKTSI